MGLGTTINVLTVLAGGSVGSMLVGARLPEKIRETAVRAIGIVTLLVGVSNFLVFEFERTPTHTAPTLILVTVK